MGLLLVAFWRLVVFDPQEGVFRPAEGVEGLLFEPSGQAPLPILALAAWMVWRRRGHLAGPARLEGAGGLGDALGFGAAAAIVAWSTHVAAPDLLAIALALVLLGLGGVLGGSAGRRAMALPAFTLLLAIPIPPVLLNRLIFDLQLWIAEMSGAIVHALGWPAVVLGIDILTPRGVFRVIEGCTGVRITSTLFVATVLYSEVSDRTPARCAVLLLCVPIVGVAVNLVRVLTIIANPYSELAGVHSTQGIVMMVVAVLAIAAIDVALSKLRPARLLVLSPGRPEAGFHVDRGFGGLLAVALALATLALATPRYEAPRRPETFTIRNLPFQLFGVRPNAIETDVHFLGSVAFSDRIDRTYGEGDGRVRVFIGEDDRSNRRGSILSRKTAYPGSGWKRTKREVIEVGPGVAGELSTFVARDGIRQELHWREDLEGFWTELYRNFLGLDRNAVLAKREPAKIFRIGVDLPHAGGDRRDELLSHAAAIRAPLRSRAGSELPSDASDQGEGERVGG